MTNTVSRTARQLEVGDYFPEENLYVEEVRHDPDGVWIEWSDGDAGYCEPFHRFQIELVED